jgi:ADP-heptose:LPS heptosyltransferase
MTHILVIRGGAVGDVVLTLPALAALRQAFPAAFVELLGTPSRAILAKHPAYANRITDQESWDLYRLFSQHARVSARLATYLGACDMVLAYLPGPHEIFARHVHQFCHGRVIIWSPHPPAGEHATEHLLRAVSEFLSAPYDPKPRVYLDPMASEAAACFWHTAGLPETGVVALHPGSGGRYKLWPLAGWQRIMTWAAQQGLPCLIISGPAEQEHVTQLLQETPLPPWPQATQLPLPQLAALLARCQVVLSHDSGVAHLAAAVGTTTLALFGPTDPFIWGPRSRHACVMQPISPGPLTLDNLPVEWVLEVLEVLYRGTFIFTPSRVDCTILTSPRREQ